MEEMNQQNNNSFHVKVFTAQLLIPLMFVAVAFGLVFMFGSDGGRGYLVSSEGVPLARLSNDVPYCLKSYDSLQQKDLATAVENEAFDLMSAGQRYASDNHEVFSDAQNDLGVAAPSRSLIAYESKLGWGFVDQYGNCVIEPQYARVSNFYENGVAEVTATNGESFYIDMNNMRVDPVYLQFEPCGYLGLAPAKNVSTNLCGFVNAAGEWIIEPQFLMAWGFGEGAYALVKANDDTGLVGVIDAKGNWVTAPTLTISEGGTFSSKGVALARDSEGKVGCITSDGEWVLGPGFDAQDLSFRDDYAAIQFFNKELSMHCWGLVNASGELVVEPTYSNLKRLSKDRWLAKSDQKDSYGIIDSEGNWVVKPCFPFAEAYSYGIAYVWV